MAIYEIGIIKNGILIIARSYYSNETNNNKETTRTTPQVINAISNLSRVILNESVKYIQYSDKVIAVYSYDIINDETEPSLNDKMQKINNITGPKKSNIAVYCVGTEEIRKIQPLTFLSKIAKKFISKYGPFSNRIEDLDRYQDFGKDIDKILKDIQFKPLDRLRLGIL